ncbi:hypothetical protein [Actinomyces culturomici]|uniref:hypothetical protein n=1 Tax=Actinomyces culturomici TaxID=1926276 RepID=UPI000E1FCFFB|nr:hypothetical protein [Actinomyces culturomici]
MTPPEQSAEEAHQPPPRREDGVSSSIDEAGAARPVEGNGGGDGPAEEPPATPVSTALRFVRLFSDLVSPANVVMALAAVVVLVTGLFGGWAAAGDDPDLVAELGASDEVSVAPFALTVDRAGWLSNVEPLATAFEPTTYLVVKARIEDEADRWVPRAILVDAMRIRELGEDAPDPVVYRAIDGTPLKTFQPGLAGDYLLVWTLPADAPRPSSLTVEYFSHTWRASTLDGGMFWTDPTLVATQVLAVRDKTSSGADGGQSADSGEGA